jgi:type II secretory pathway pseudopilin PulG
MKKYKTLLIAVFCLVILSVILILIAVILSPRYYYDLKFGFVMLGRLCGMAGILGGITLFVASVFTEKIKWSLLHVLAIVLIGFLSVFILPRFGIFGNFSAKIWTVKDDLRHLAKAIERYHSDNKKYPPWARGEEGVNRFAPGTGAYKMHTFAKDALTSPIKYIESYPHDPFSDTKGATYGYYTDGVGFIIYSWGPNTDENAPGGWELEADIEKVYDSRIPQPSFTLLTGKSSAPKGGAYTYDPSNGMVSEGDIYLVK